MSRDRVLIVDDDPDIRNILELYLENEGFEIVTVTEGSEAINSIDGFKPDLIILDIMMPGLDGYETCQGIREKTDAPILFLSAKEDDLDKILGLRIGGDDYITKPFSPSVLVARIKAHLRRTRISRNKKVIKEERSVIEFPGLMIDLDSCLVRSGGITVTLAAKEYQLLSLLSQNVEKVFSVEQLFQLIWGENSLGDNRTVMVHISNLRKKIEPNPTKPIYILTVRGIGYKFNGYIHDIPQLI
ncbi:response regulator transcription factor [Robertmurraya massiliosenegalensis]|uniref:response regulator transcription factor n=1 Tax=Robertmurraya massiliosenegalensis TaxID=1287657 RepID=UPI00031FC8EF|nr:response regulator transcription factor [Robertmurraya massiliosenegalensis]